ncbi:MAG: hypothetical protein R3D60_14240 [Paracoccaceae bacterium]
MREVVADMRDAVGDTMGLSLRVSLDESIAIWAFPTPNCAIIEMHRDLPDLGGIWRWARGRIVRARHGSRTRPRKKTG